MKLVADFSGNYEDCIERYWELERYCNQDDTNEVLFHGYASTRNVKLRNDYYFYKRKIYINIEAPCSFFSPDDPLADQSYFNEVYSICPYSSEYFDKIKDVHPTRHIAIPWMYSKNYTKENEGTQIHDKIYDVMYMGFFHSKLHA
jgi:hypothetical protein